MYCRYCGEKQQADAKFCHHCGKSLDPGMANESEKEEFFRRRKEKNKWYVILAVLVVVGLTVVFVIVPIWIGFSMSVHSSDIYGTWDCGENEVLYISESGKFQLYNSESPMKLEIVGTYETDWDYDFDKDYIEYDLDLYTDRYTIDGVTNTDLHLIEYDGVIQGNNKDQLLLQSQKSSNIVRCTRMTD